METTTDFYSPPLLTKRMVNFGINIDIKNEPEDLTGHSHGGAVGQGRRHSEAGHSPPSLHADHPGIPLDVAAKRLMGDAIDKTTNMVTSVISGPEGENHIVLTGEGSTSTIVVFTVCQISKS